jgi:hypothetical protein
MDVQFFSSAPFSASSAACWQAGLGLPSIIVMLGAYSIFAGLSLVANQNRAVFPPTRRAAS